MPGEEVQGDERAERDLTTMAPEHAAQRLASSLLDFNDQLERILEAAVVVVLGALLTTSLAAPGLWFPEVLWLAPLLFLVVRPLSVTVALAGTATSWSQRALMSWFGTPGLNEV